MCTGNSFLTFQSKLGADIRTCTRHANVPSQGANHDNDAGLTPTEKGQHRASHFDGAENIGIVLPLKDLLASVRQYVSIAELIVQI